MSSDRTEFPFTLPRGYVDTEGKRHKEGTMRLATAKDEVAPLWRTGADFLALGDWIWSAPEGAAKAIATAAACLDEAVT